MSQALEHASKLKPAIRLAQAISDFGASLASSQHKATFRMLQTRSPPTAAEVIRLTEEINRDGSRQHRSWRPYGTRLVSILDKIRLFTKAGDILIGGSQNMIASGVWAVVRMSLQVATGFLTYFDQISELFMKVKRSTTIHQDTAALFPDCEELQEFMCEYLVIFVKFCQEIVGFASKSFISQLKTAMGSSFDSECKTFEATITVWSDLIDQKIRFLTAQSQIASEKATVRNSRALKFLSSSNSRNAAATEEKRRLWVLHRLSPQQSRYDSTWRRQRRKGTASWILREHIYENWKRDSGSLVLWVSGNIGSGKTVLLASIVADLLSTDWAPAPQPPIVAQFFCQYDDSHSLESTTVIGSIASQFIRTLDKGISSSMLAEFESEQHDPSVTAELLKKYLPNDRWYFVVVDAIDVCAPDDIDEILGLLGSLSAALRVRLCCASRTDSRVSEEAKRVFKVIAFQSMINRSKDDEMEQFITCEVERRAKWSHFNNEALGLIRQALVAGSQGMYLWVALQLDRIFPKYGHATDRDSDVIDILDNMPTDLQQSYDRATQRIKDRQAGRKAFQLVTASSSTRPLQADEFNIALNVKPDDPFWEPSTFSRDPWSNVASMGGGLLEIDEETQTVHFIHHSALQYVARDDGETAASSSDAKGEDLASTLDQANLTLGRICITYLNYPCFDRQVAKNQPVVSLEGAAATERLYDTAVSQLGGITGKLVSPFLRHRPSKPRHIDVDRLLERYRRSRPTTDEMLRLSDFARDYWLDYTKLFKTAPGERSRSLFAKLVSSPSAHVKGRWQEDDGALQWATEHDHSLLIRVLMDVTHFEWFAQTLFKFYGERFLEGGSLLEGRVLGNIVARLLNFDYITFLTVHTEDYESMILQLIRRGADPHLRLTEESPSTLNMALIGGSSPGFIAELIDRGAVVEPEGADFESRPLILAIGKALPLECTELLLRRGAIVDAPTLNRLVYTLAPDDLQALRTAVEGIVTPNALLLMSATLSRGDLAFPLLRNPFIGNPSSNLRGTTPLMAAVDVGNLKMATFLLTLGASPS